MRSAVPVVIACLRPVFVKTILIHLISGFVVGAAALMAQSSTRPNFPTDAQICDMLVERVDTQHQSVGIAVGVIDATGRRTVSYGRFDADDKRAVDADTIFERVLSQRYSLLCSLPTWCNGGKSLLLIRWRNTCPPA
jgi:hypothetical protein